MCPRCTRRFRAGKPLNCTECEETLGGAGPTIRGSVDRAAIQPKLAVNDPNDQYEREADRVAEQVMRMPDSKSVTNCRECDERLQRKERSDDSGAVDAETNRQGQSRPSGSRPLPNAGRSRRTPASTPDTELRRATGRGKPLGERDRNFMERRFGADFGDVRVHTGRKAARMNRMLNARAFTHGRDIYFGAGAYRPGTSSGRRLLAHELTHVIQQGRRGGNAGPPEIQRAVEMCCRTVQTGKTLIDTMSAALNIQHCWIETDEKAAGMGPADEGPLPANPIGVETKVTDHSHEDSDDCTPKPQADEECVNNYLTIGMSTGRWGPFNNCNTFANDVIDRCSWSTQPHRVDQLRCVIRRGACPNTRAAGMPSPDEIATYNEQCREETDYSGPDVTPTSEDCDRYGG